jgi:hypothetical protein
MMRAFGKEVLSIRWTWRRGFQGAQSLNLDKVNELTARGISLDEAVRETWTATRAKRWGVTEITVVNTEGGQGNYTKMDVLIQNPRL